MHDSHKPTVRRPVHRVSSGASSREDDLLASEEPLEIRLQWDAGGTVTRKSIAITMRTPGRDHELAVGFLSGEGVVQSREDIVDVSHCTDPEEQQALNIVTVTLRPGVSFDASRLERHFYTTSSCGVCGKAALEALEVQGCSALPEGLEVSEVVVCRMPAVLRGAQVLFDQTGGLHAAGLFDADGKLLSVEEDVGRHNAVDKLIGGQILAGRVPLESTVIALSGRISFELVQKALVARVPMLVAVGAPSSLAVEVAESFGMTLLGFVKPDRFNIYTGAERVKLSARAALKEASGSR